MTPSTPAPVIFAAAGLAAAGAASGEREGRASAGAARRALMALTLPSSARHRGSPGRRRSAARARRRLARLDADRERPRRPASSRSRAASPDSSSEAIPPASPVRARVGDAGARCDEERQAAARRIASATPARRAVKPGAGDRGDGHAEAPRVRLDVVHRHGVAEQPLPHRLDPPQQRGAQRRAGRLLGVGTPRAARGSRRPAGRSGCGCPCPRDGRRRRPSARSSASTRAAAASRSRRGVDDVVDPQPPSSFCLASTSIPCRRARLPPRILRLAWSVSCG